MQLLYRAIDGRFHSKEFVGDRPKYAILSHRWVADEPTFQDIKNGTGTEKAGYLKLEFCAQQAAADRLEYFWIDTVCIDKLSSAVLSESLISMYRWYQEAEKCYVFMADVMSFESDFHKSVWFTRGWTLQELIAPRIVEFYASNHSFIGDRKSLERRINEITQIPLGALRGDDLSSFSTEEKLSWADSRTTEREEDRAYCLMGILEVSMAVLYGEGKKAFKRLMREVQSEDNKKLDNQHVMSLRYPPTPPATPPTTPPTEDILFVSENYDKVKSTLFSKEVQSRHSQVKLPSTPTWLFEQQAFLDWENALSTGPESAIFLTLQGKAGTGKSVLVKEAILRAESQDKLVLYHYFGQSQNRKSGLLIDPLEELYTSLLYQLLCKCRSYSAEFIRTWGEMLRNDPSRTPWSISDLQDAVLETIKGFHEENNKIFVFIDALEQSCTGESGVSASRLLDILKSISTLQHSAAASGMNLRICCSRRHLPAFGKSEPVTKTIVVEEHNTTVLHAFISDQLSGIENTLFRHMLKRKIMKRAANDFSWVTTVVQNVISASSSSTNEEVLKVVDQVPRTYMDMFEKLLGEDSSSDRRFTLQLLQMVSGAVRPMTPDQFRHALAFDGDFAHDTIAKWEMSAKGIRGGEMFANYLCQRSYGLVEIYNTPEDGEIVRFSHSSVDSFLREPNSVLPRNFLPWDERCQLLLLQMSLRCLSLSSHLAEDEVAFAQYAAENWSYHARGCGDLLSEMEVLPKFFVTKCTNRKPRIVIEKQIKALKVSQGPVSHLLEGSDSLMVLLASTGCTGLLERHLSACSICKEACESSGEPFFTAMRNALIAHWTDAASLLLATQISSGTKMDMSTVHEYQTFLYRACYFAQKEVVNFLLEKGADPLTHSPSGYEYPLHVAIELGLGEIINVLLKHGKVREQFQLRRKGKTFKGSTALHIALRSRQRLNDRLAILELLLKFAPKGTRILHVQDDEGISPLQLVEKLRSQRDPTGRLQDMADEIEEFSDDEDEGDSDVPTVFRSTTLCEAQS